MMKKVTMKKKGMNEKKRKGSLGERAPKRETID